MPQDNPPPRTGVKNGLLVGLGFAAGAASILFVVYGSSRFQGNTYFEQPLIGSGGALETRVDPLNSGTGQTVDGWLVLTTQGTSRGCTATGGLAKYNTCFINTGSTLLRARAPGMSGRLLKEVIVMGDATPVGSFTVDITFPRDATGESGTGSAIHSRLNNVTVSTGSHFRIAFTGGSLGTSNLIWDRYSSVKVSTVSANTARSAFRVLLNYMDIFDQ